MAEFRVFASLLSPGQEPSGVRLRCKGAMHPRLVSVGGTQVPERGAISGWGLTSRKAVRGPRDKLRGQNPVALVNVQPREGELKAPRPQALGVLLPAKCIGAGSNTGGLALYQVETLGVDHSESLHVMA